MIPFWYRVQYRYLMNWVHYESASVAHPLAILEVNSASIEYDGLYVPKEENTGMICGGDWDLDRTRLGEHPTHEGLKQRCVEGRSWTETAYYEWAEHRFKSEGPFWSYEIHRRVQNGQFAYLEELYDRI